MAATLAFAAGATGQTRQFSFAYDQPKNSGYGVGAEIFDKKLKELSKDAFSPLGGPLQCNHSGARARNGAY